MSEERSEIQKLLLEIWRGAGALQKKVESLDKFRSNMTPAKIMARDSAQNGLRGWIGFNLGELLNEYGLPPETRD